MIKTRAKTAPKSATQEPPLKKALKASLKAVKAEKKAAKTRDAAKPKPAVKAAKPLGQRAQIEADAAAGKLPAPVIFENATAPDVYKKQAADLAALAKAGDLRGLKAAKIPSYNSYVRKLAVYRDLAVIALQAKG